MRMGKIGKILSGIILGTALTFNPLVSKAEDTSVRYYSDQNVVQNRKKPERGPDIYISEEKYGTCKDGIDNDNDKLIDKEDPDCLVISSDGTIRFNPYLNEKNDDSKVIKEPKLKPYGGNAEFLMGTINGTEDITSLDGEIIGYGASISIPSGSRVEFTISGLSVDIQGDYSNENFNDLGSLEKKVWGVKGLVRMNFLNENLVVESGVGYTNQKRTITINPMDLELEQTTTDTSLVLNIEYIIKSDKFNTGIKLGTTQVSSKIEQDLLDKKFSTSEYVAGINVNGKLFEETDASLGVDYILRNSFDPETDANDSDGKINGSNVRVYGDIGVNNYLRFKVELPATNEGISETSYYIGAGRKELLKKVPVGVELGYYVNDMSVETDYRKIEQEVNTWGAQLYYNYDKKKDLKKRDLIDPTK